MGVPYEVYVICGYAHDRASRFAHNVKEAFVSFQCGLQECIVPHVRLRNLQRQALVMINCLYNDISAKL